MEYQETKETIVQTITAGMKDEQASIALYDALLPIMERFDGKQITRRIATAVTKAFPDWTVYYDDNYSLFAIRVWGGSTGRDYNGAATFYLGYKSSPTFTLEHFKDTNAWAGSAARERNTKREAILSDDARIAEMAEAFAAFTEAKARFDAALDGPIENPSKYAIEKALGIDKRR
jgi:hypothetical protein